MCFEDMFFYILCEFVYKEKIKTKIKKISTDVIKIYKTCFKHYDSPTETLKILVMLPPLLMTFSVYSPESVFLVCVMFKDPV